MSSSRPSVATAAHAAARADWPSLADKYAILVRLRRRRETLAASGVKHFPPDELAARKTEMTALAARFPGALRELDACASSLLAAKHAAVLTSTTPAPWILAVHDFHLLLRDLLALKRVLAFHLASPSASASASASPSASASASVSASASASPLPSSALATLATFAASRAAAGQPLTWPHDPDSLSSLHRPSRGRVLPLVFHALTLLHNRPRPWLERAVFGHPDELPPVPGPHGLPPVPGSDELPPTAPASHSDT